MGITPWDLYGNGATWMLLMSLFVSIPCAVVGCFLILRQMSLVGDAISHSALPGIVVAFYFVGDLSSPWLLIGAALAGVLVTLLIEQIHKWSRVKQDSAIGIAFTTLFALGLILRKTLLGGKVHLDMECIVEGNLQLVAFQPKLPQDVLVMGAVAAAVVILVVVFYRVLSLTAFDTGLAASFGVPTHLVHYLMMALLAVVVVAGFEAVGAILVIALLILPGATAYLCTHRLKVMILLSVLHAVISSVLGLFIHVWSNGKASATVVIVGLGLFLLAWLFGAVDGVVVKFFARRRRLLEG